MFERIGVVGGGIMGAGIAETCARQGLDVRLIEADPQRCLATSERIDSSLARAVRSGKLDRAERRAAFDRISVTDELSHLADRQLVVQAVAEDEAQKVAIFAQLDRIVQDPDAIFATNTSSIPIMKLAVSTGRADRVTGLHFFNPVPVMGLVEVVPSLLTATAVVNRVERFVTDQLGNRTIRSEDRAGFIVNALLVPYLLAAIRMHESGFATAEDIDAGMVWGCAHPLGPLALSDLIGLDTVLAVADSLYQEFKEPLYAPTPLLSRMVDAGLLGRKSGRGFHIYADGRTATTA